MKVNDLIMLFEEQTKEEVNFIDANLKTSDYKDGAIYAYNHAVKILKGLLKRDE